MSRPRNYQTEAIVIKKTKLGEADRILTLYTPGLGKIQAVAKGVRRPRSRMSGHLELLTHTQIALARGKNIDTVTGTQTIDAFLPLRNDLDRAAAALYAAELVNQFTPEAQENEPVFRLLLETLQRLSQGADIDLTLRYFELHLLEASGYRPQLESCVVCRGTLPPICTFSPGAGGTLCANCRSGQPYGFPLSAEARNVLVLLQNNDFGAAGGLPSGSGTARQLEMTLRYYIRFLLEREVKSTRWLDTLRKQNDDIQTGQHTPAAPAQA